MSGSSAQAPRWLAGQRLAGQSLAEQEACFEGSSCPLVLRLTLGGLVGGNFSSDTPHRSWAASPPPTHSLLGPDLGLSPLPPPTAGQEGLSTTVPREAEPPRARLQASGLE